MSVITFSPFSHALLLFWKGDFSTNMACLHDTYSIGEFQKPKLRLFFYIHLLRVKKVCAVHVFLIFFE